MNERKIINRTYPLLTMLIGLITFSISGSIVGLISSSPNDELEGVILLIAVPIGSLLMLFMLHMLSKDKILAVIIRSEIGYYAGFLIGVVLVFVLTSISPFISDLMYIKSQIIYKTFILFFADAIFGAYLADLFYGHKAVLFFLLVCGIVSIPFGFLLDIPINMIEINFDSKVLLTLASFGTTTGFSIGLYRVLNFQSKSKLVR